MKLNLTIFTPICKFLSYFKHKYLFMKKRDLVNISLQFRKVENLVSLLPYLLASYSDLKSHGG